MKKTILLIEDDKFIRENTAEILELANFIVLTAANGKTGVSLAKRIIPDIIICDILMPQLDGYGVLQIISKTPKLEHIPFIFLTAKTHYEDLRKGMELGADDYISKPFEESELLRAIEIRLKRAKAFENKTPLQQAYKSPQKKKIRNFKNIDELLKHKTIYNYKKDETIYCKGNLSKHIFLINKGEVKTYKINEQGKEFNTGFYTNKQYFGYSSFVKKLPHFENSKAITDVKLYKINKSDISVLLKANPEVLYNFIDLLATNVIDNTEQLMLLAYASVRKKTARTLLKLSKNNLTEFNGTVKITRSDLANTVGIAKETLIRTLHDLKDENIIKENRKGITIINENHLMKIQ